MKTIVYVDILLITNFLCGWFLLQASARLCNAALAWWRAILACIAAAASTLILLAPPMPTAASLLYKLATAFAIVWLAFGFKGWRPFLRCASWYFLLNLGLAGAVILAIYRGNFEGMQINNLSVYMNLSPFVLIFCVLATYLFLRLMLLLFGRPGPQNIWTLQVRLQNASFSVQAYHDTGFLLSDPISGKQAILVSWPAVRGFLPEETNTFLSEYFAGQNPLPPQSLGLRILPCSSIGGHSALPTLVAAQATLLQKSKQWDVSGVPVAFVPALLGDGQFAALFGNEFLLNETKRRKQPCAPN